MRGDSKPNLTTSLSLSKTVFTSLIIAGAITFLAAFFPVYRAAEGVTDLAGHYLPWLLPYGICCIIAAFLGVLGLTSVNQNDVFLKLSGIFGVVVGALTSLAGLPLVIAFGNWEFFISLAAIGVCIVIMGALEIAANKKGE